MPAQAGAPPGGGDQDKLLEEALQVVKSQSFQMKRSLDGSKLMEGLKHASKMLCELRTSVLSPKAYYELYMAISDELRHLELYLVDEFQKGKKVSDLYELVQYAGNIIPRLYLLVTVGTVYIKAKNIPTKDILKDLVEMCRGVQHPLRGLFLRNYLLQSIKRDLPEDTVETKHGSVDDSIDFVLLNFSEMNKLWVRMQHQGHSRNKGQREKERRELRILVGTNLVRLSSLEGVLPDTYAKKILPSILEQIVVCKDSIAQEYLMECIIQVFPDEMHLQTLTPFLDACGQLEASVNVKNIIIALIDRLAAFSLRDGPPAIPDELNLFELFSGQVAQVIKLRSSMPTVDCIALQVSLANLAIKCYGTQLEYVNKVLEDTAEILTSREEAGLGHGNQATRELVKLLKICIDDYDSIATALSLEKFVDMFAFFDFDLRQEMALHALQSVADKGTHLSNVDEVETYLKVIAPAISDQEDQPSEAPDPEDFLEEQSLVGRFVTLLQAETPDMQYQMISLTKKKLSGGGAERLKFTMPALVFKAFRLAQQYAELGDTDPNWEKKMKKIFTFCHQIISGLAKAEFTDLALRLFLQAALTANSVEFEATESIAYEFWTQAITLYEEEVSESVAQIAAITLMVGTLEAMTCFGEDNQSTLATKCAIISSKLVKKSDQSKGVCLCAHLFWSCITLEDKGPKKDGKQVQKCLKKATKVAKSCMEPLSQAAIFVEILNRAILFYEWGAPEVPVESLVDIVGEVREALESLVDEEEADPVRQYFEATLAYIEEKKAAGGEFSYEGASFDA